MKKLFTLFILISLSGVAVNSLKAQATSSCKEISSPQAKAKQVLAKMSAACNFAECQSSKLNFVYANYFRKFDEYQSTPKGTIQNFELKMRLLKRNLQESIQSILTPDQMSKWMAYQQSESAE